VTSAPPKSATTFIKSISLGLAILSIPSVPTIVASLMPEARVFAEKNGRERTSIMRNKAIL